MTKQEIKKLSKRQNQVCGIINRLSSEGRINQAQATDYTGLVLFNPCLTIEWLEEIAIELQAN